MSLIFFQWQGSGGLTSCWKTDPTQAYNNLILAKKIAKHPAIKKFYREYGTFGCLNERATIQRIGARMAEQRKKLKLQMKVILLFLPFNLIDIFMIKSLSYSVAKHVSHI